MNGKLQIVIVLKLIAKIIVAAFSGILLAAIIFTVGSPLFGNSTTANNLIFTFFVVMIFAPIFGGAQAMCAIAASLIARRSGFLSSWPSSVVASFASLSVALLMFHKTLGQPNRDLVWHIFNTTPLFIVWNLGLGFGCWYGLVIADRYMK